MNPFEEIAAALGAARAQFAETVRDDFGRALLAEGFEPLLAEAYGLAALSDEATAAMAATARALEEARAADGGDVV